MKNAVVILIVSSLMLIPLGDLSENNPNLRIANDNFSSIGHFQTNNPEIIGLEENGTYIEESLSVISPGVSDVIRNLQVSSENGTIKLIHYLTDQNLWNLDSWDGEKWTRQYGVGEKRVTNWDDDGFKGKFFIYNHTFYETRYSIDNYACSSGSSGFSYIVNISIHEYGDQKPILYSDDQCLPSSYGIVEFDISSNKIGYVVSGTGSQGGGFAPGQNAQHYRADAGMIFDLENLSFDVVNYGDRYANMGSSNGNGANQFSEDFALLDNMSCLFTYGNGLNCLDNNGTSINSYSTGINSKIIKSNDAVYLLQEEIGKEVVKLSFNGSITEISKVILCPARDTYTGVTLWYAMTCDNEIYSAYHNTTTNINTEFLLFSGNGTKGFGKNFIEIRKNEVGNTDLYALWHDLDNDTITNDNDVFPYETSQYIDTDNDGYGDNPNGFEGDSCPSRGGNSTLDVFGCPDSDNDGYSNDGDLFPFDLSQWNDTDFDGYGDNPNGFQPDSCPLSSGISSFDRYGCVDSDRDGYSDPDQLWLAHPLGLADAFSFESTQSRDTDGDGYGDFILGFEGDNCPANYGTSTIDRYGCIDSDEDQYSDIGDELPLNPTQHEDRDGDGFGDNQSGTEPDVFPTDGTQWIDSDGDGYGDNVLGNQGDAFPDDPLEWKDSDGDYLGDNADMFPFDPTQTEDRDGDGMGDNPMGIGADKFPDDPTQWGDIDGDGYGDNALGNNPDVFITDATQWFDRDGDGRGDNDQGRNYDRFPDNPTQWIDLDEDGLGDNQSGTNADPFLNDFDNDGYNDSIDILPKLASPGDLDADGCLDEVDAFPENSQECVDTDGDGIGNNGDSDDDGDGWTDADEERLGTDSLSSSSKPVDSFEIVIPGTSVGLGAWDLIGMFGGIPLFGWIAFGFATRNGRCQRYEELLNSANSRDELEQVALRWEYSLMLRMLGPHQGIRLERLRAELDDKFENTTYDETEIGYDQTNIVENEGKDIPPINESITEPTKETAATSTDESGYEWFKQGEENWYRPIGSDDEWLKFDE
ncbi:MAG: hypothetical protein ACJZ5B_02640 [Candidatus Poseidoniaceae archaeon]